MPNLFQVYHLYLDATMGNSLLIRSWRMYVLVCGQCVLLKKYSYKRKCISTYASEIKYWE